VDRLDDLRNMLATIEEDYQKSAIFTPPFST
jgi:hypothetical protein